MKIPLAIKILLLVLVCNLLLIFNPLSIDFVQSSNQNTSLNLLSEQDITITEFNRYYPDGNISILVAVDTQLLGENKFFNNNSRVKTVFENWLEPLEKRFNIKFHVYEVTTFTPGEEDSLDVSIENVASNLSWTFAEGITDTSVNGNNYDFLIIFQERYNTGQNRVNAVYGNALIISHNQFWTSDQLILLHEVGHLFGGIHYAEGVVPTEWYGSANKTIMSYNDIFDLKFSGWNKSFLPLDDYNFERINASKYRFDQNDADLDGLPNYYENRYGMNPCLNETFSDIDNDGLTDLEEFLYGTHPLQGDSDKDTYSDWAENYLDTSPINSSDFPILDIPVLVTWSKNQEITKDQKLTLQWRGIATNKDTYSIYQNNTLLISSQWNQELIFYEVTGLEPGRWVFKCVVTESNGNSANADITIIILEEKEVFLEFSFSLLAILSFIVKKRVFVK
ncbi:MAG: hypothetical protein KAT16_07200 [Candidatus Heimdallarchaeota archaeon]|nr:hypothetical protein [Candidatus Heimdallarchaeota archaeon]